ncbi:MAG: hypothetical protein ACM3ZR_04495 [Pseudomonadota bacterium]
MNEFEKIRITHGPSIELMVDNPTKLKLVGKGAHGAVYRLSYDRCVKIYADKDIALMEANAYNMAGHSAIVPKVYEAGDSYLIMEYIQGVSLAEMLSEKKEITFQLSVKLTGLFKEMKNLGFTRLDASLRHIIVTPENSLRLIDLVHAYEQDEAYPKLAFVELEKLSLLTVYFAHLEKIDQELYKKWLERNVLHE